MSDRAWGSPDRYYAQKERRVDEEDNDRQHFTDHEIVESWGEVLREIHPDLIERIHRTYKNWHPVLRSHLRDETGLKHPAGRGKRSLSVEVVPGLPWQLGEILKQFKGKEWILLGRDKLEDARDGAGYIMLHHEAAKSLYGSSPIPGSVEEVKHFQDLADGLVKKCDVASIEAAFRALHEDTLGAYFYRRYKIQLYWMAIGIISSWIRVSPEALTVVVLAHELAHAYSHEGRDIGDKTWNTEVFAQADTEIVEGIAQFYTQVICNTLGDRDPTIVDAYERFLALQSGPYRVHDEWVKWGADAGEVIRAGLIANRTRLITSFDDFQEALNRQRELMERKSSG